MPHGLEKTLNSIVRADIIKYRMLLQMKEGNGTHIHPGTKELDHLKQTPVNLVYR